ncbi:MAG: threonine/serine exporter family protein [Lachnospiraceae bacterium]|nr:threonine/serine exporter family protein [Lachnospiraceae bacterium]
MGKPQDVLEFAVDLGEMMLQFGGEIYRVEDTIRRILQAYQVERADVYVLSNGIFVGVRGQGYSLVRQVSLGTINLRGIAALNQLSRDVVEGECSLDEGNERLEIIKRMPREKSLVLCFSCGIGCGMYALLLQGIEWKNSGALLGGSVWDLPGTFPVEMLWNAAGAFAVGVMLEMATLWMGKRNMVRLVRSLFGSILVTITCLALIGLGMPVSQDKVIISGTLPLFPGIAFTTSIRDFFNGDHLSGVIHLLDALLTALCIAAGVGIVIAILSAVE